MSIELLTTSAGDFAKCQERDLSDYIMNGFSVTKETKYEAERDLREDAERAGCVVVVDLRYNVNPGHSETFLDIGSDAEYTVAGTGLRPR